MTNSDPVLDYGGEDPAFDTLDLQDYWNEERRRTAIPLLPKIDSHAGLDPAPTVDHEDQQRIVREPVRATTDRNTAYPNQPDAPSNHGINASEVQNVLISPYCSVGKLFMRFGDKHYVGSAWSAGPSAVMTAGHCLYDHEHNAWAKNVMFVPAYSNGQMPFGSWGLKDKVCFREWTKKQNYAFDVAAFKVTRPIETEVGSLGWRAFDGIITPFTAAGYPSESPFDGKLMWQSTSHVYHWVDRLWYMNCRFNGGASGGPWIVWKDRNPYAFGLNSHTSSDYNGKMFSPQFLACLPLLDKWMNH